MMTEHETVVYERDEIIVSIVGGNVVITERVGAFYETATVSVEGYQTAMTVDGPTWGDAAKGHKAMIRNLAI